MRLTYLAATALAIAVTLGSNFAVAAETSQPPTSPAPGMMGYGSGMMGYGPGMMNCPVMSGGMMSGSMMGRGMMPMLPPGHEKLQLQMQAEIMQKVGEIMAKYANQIQSSR